MYFANKLLTLLIYFLIFINMDKEIMNQQIMEKETQLLLSISDDDQIKIQCHISDLKFKIQLEITKTRAEIILSKNKRGFLPPLF